MARKTVLLVDDDPVFIEAITAVLETKYEIRTAANGAAALKSIAAAVPDVIVLDVMMDHLSEGFDVAQKVKGDPRTQHVPVIMLTGVDEVYDYRMEVEESHVPHDRWLEKPVEPAQLLAVIGELVSGSET